ncbi:hypothetical protein PENTCL1PPCAC_13980, partial [Pristionchus entomophagus]
SPSHFSNDHLPRLYTDGAYLARYPCSRFMQQVHGQPSGNEDAPRYVFRLGKRGQHGGNVRGGDLHLHCPHSARQRRRSTGYPIYGHHDRSHHCRCFGHASQRHVDVQFGGHRLGVQKHAHQYSNVLHWRLIIGDC